MVPHAALALLHMTAREVDAIVLVCAYLFFLWEWGASVGRSNPRSKFVGLATVGMAGKVAGRYV